MTYCLLEEKKPKKKKPSAKLKDILYQCSKVVNFKTEFENKK